METTMAQIANEVLGINPARVSLVHGDTALTPYSIGTIASRSMVMAGGAVSQACKVLAGRMTTIGAHLLQCDESAVAVTDGKIIGPTGEVDFAEIGRVWYIHPEELPDNVDRAGVEVTTGYRPEPDTGAFSYASTAAVVAVDPDLGSVEILDYLAVEDCGRMVNPLIVTGQIIGGTAQGIGTALYEESPYSDTGQPLATTFVDYTMPGPTETDAIRVEHMETPSPFTEYGIKGVGESGAISPPATIANAINDALSSMGVELRESPMTPRRVLAAIQEARRTGGS
jgi:carbon-monoxide dehydrogenase large subunit